MNNKTIAFLSALLLVAGFSGLMHSDGLYDTLSSIFAAVVGVIGISHAFGYNIWKI